MEKSAEVSVLARLERAEQAARERRLSAEAEAERELEAAARTVVEIEAGAPTRVAAALTALREDHLRRARDEIATIEAELTALEAGEVGRPRERERFGQAVEHVVAAVLGEA